MPKMGKAQSLNCADNQGSKMLATKLGPRLWPAFLVALIVVKSKPLSLSIEEYSKALCACIRQNRSRREMLASQKNLDATAFWRDAFARSQEEQIALRARVMELESMVNQDVHKTPDGQTRYQQKRLRDPESSAETIDVRSIKTPRRANMSSPMHRRGRSAVDPAKVSSSPQQNNFVSAFLQNIYILEDQRSRPSISIHSVTTTLNTLLHVVTQRVITCGSATLQTRSGSPSSGAFTSANQVQGLESTQSGYDEDYVSDIRNMNSAFPIILGVVNQLHKDQGARDSTGSLIHGMVDLFKNTIHQIFQMAKCVSKLHVESKHEQGTASHENQQSDTGRRPNFGSVVSATILAMCDFCLALICGLDITKESHLNIHEGCLYVLLTEMGHRLRNFVFETAQEGRGWETPADETGLVQTVNNPQDTPDIDCNPDTESQCLIYLLSRIPHLSRAFTVTEEDQSLPPPSSQETSDSSPAGKSLPRSNKKITSQAGIRFQHTLLRAVFGDDDPTNTDFMLALRFPRTEKSDDGHDWGNHLKKEEIRDWFKHEVWRLVGWDVLKAKVAPNKHSF